MAAYNFATITPAQALGLSSVDSIAFDVSAKNLSVLFNLDGTYTVLSGDRSVVFGAEFHAFTGSRISFVDGSLLYLGTSGADVRDYSNVVPSSGAMFGGAGNDTLTTSSGDWKVQGNQGDDRINAHADGAYTIYGGQGNDSISIASRDAQFVQGNLGADTIQGGLGSDTLIGGQGDDRIYAGGGDGFINGNLGNDILEGAGRVFGEGGDDELVLSPGSGPGLVRGGDGDDHVTIGGGEASDAMPTQAFGDGGNDTIASANFASDEIRGGDGDDRIAVINNASLLTPGAGDLLFGEGGADSIRGGNGGDTINGGEGADTLTGGDGADLFILTDHTTTLTPGTIDRITDWQAIDHIQLRAPIGTSYDDFTNGSFDAAVENAGIGIRQGIEVLSVQVGGDVYVFVDAGPANTIDVAFVLVGRTLADISENNFV